MSKLTGSKKALQFTESVIREMTRLSDAHGAVNLSQGFPDFSAPMAVKEAACSAINADDNQYAVTWGQRPLREAVAREFTRRYGVEVVAEKIEAERQVIDVLELDIAYGQGHLFGEPRAIREAVLAETTPPADFMHDALGPRRAAGRRH